MVSRLPAGVALAVEELGKRNTNVHELRYMPAVSLAARLRSRREGVPVGFAGGFEDDDEEDDEEEEDEEIELSVAPRGEWVLRDVTFAVAAGEAVGLVGDRASIAALMRILAGMTAPTTGRFSYRGRPGLSSEMALRLARREMIDTRVALRTLAALAGVPHRRRKEWMSEVKSLAGGVDGHRLAAGSKAFHINLAIAASVDPSADVLLLDRFPRQADDGLLEHCLERVRRRLAAGAGAVVATPDTQVLEGLCARAVRLEAGQVVATGPAHEIVAARRELKSQPDRTIKPFNADAALISAALVDGADRPARALLHGGPFRALVRLETTHADTQVIWRIRLDGARTAWLSVPEWRTIRAPGEFLVALELPVAEFEEPEYVVAVEVIVRVGARRETLRRVLGRYGVAAATDAERGEGAFDPFKLTAELAQIDASTGDTLVDPEV